MHIQQWPLPYSEKLPSRSQAEIDLVVMHCTELPDLSIAREYGERVLYDSGAGNCGHFYIDRDGSVHEWMSPLRTAHHTRGYNPRSIGIEIINLGRYPHWMHSQHQEMQEPYTDQQLQSCIALLQHLRAKFSALKFIAGHEDLDTAWVEASDNPEIRVPRKRDPGPWFDWPRILQATSLERIYAEKQNGS
jgi:N-acetylmuramoyl-L-alanine amidase